MAKIFRRKKQRNLIGPVYQVLTAFVNFLKSGFCFGTKDSPKIALESVRKLKHTKLPATQDDESVIVVKNTNSVNHDKAGEISVNYNVYFLPSPQKKAPVLKDASNELLRMSMFSVEYHKYLQKEFLEFAHG